MDHYVGLMPAIRAARPLQPEVKAAPLSGIDWHVEQWRQGVTGGIVGVPAGTAVRPEPRGDAVLVTIAVPAGCDAFPVANTLADFAEQRGNLGRYAVAQAAHPQQAYLIRRGVLDTSMGWDVNRKTWAFFNNDGTARRDLFAVCGLTQKNKRTQAVRYPNVETFGADSRGGTVELRLHPGQLLAQVKGAEPKLRQALECPDLEVDSVGGIHPLIRLNSKAITADFPRENPLPPELFVRPRTQAERYAAAGNFVLPVGVRADGSAILRRQSVVPHMAVFGGTGSGKTYFLTSIVRAACLQGAEVLLVDAKNGKDLRAIARRRFPGVVHFGAKAPANLHRAVLYAADEFERRTAMAGTLAARGIEYTPTPLVLVIDEWGSWIHNLNKGDKEKKEAARETISRVELLAAEARELNIFIIISGQHSYVSALPGTFRDNLRTLIVLGPPNERHINALFEGPRQREARELGAQINPTVKGRGLIADQPEDGEMTISMFQGFFNPGDSDAETAFAEQLTLTPKLRRFGWKFPRGDESGGDGSWQTWTPATEPSSDELHTVYLDGPDGQPIPELAVYDPTSTEYSPGAKQLADRHTHLDSHA